MTQAGCGSPDRPLCAETGMDPHPGQGGAAIPSERRPPFWGARSAGGLKERPQTPALLLGQLFHRGPHGAGCHHAPSQLMLPPSSQPLCLPQPHLNTETPLAAPWGHSAPPSPGTGTGQHPTHPPRGVPEPGAAAATHPTPHSITIHPKDHHPGSRPAQFSGADLPHLTPPPSPPWPKSQQLEKRSRGSRSPPPTQAAAPCGAAFSPQTKGAGGESGLGHGF